VIGDSGKITAASSAGQQLAGIPMTFGLIETTTSADGGNDTITTGIGYDIVLGGQGGDTIIANFGETSTDLDAGNIVLGDNGLLDYTRADRETAAGDTHRPSGTLSDKDEGFGGKTGSYGEGSTWW